MDIDKPQAIKSVNPVTGALTEYRVPSSDEINATVRDARESFDSWKELDLEDRSGYLGQIRDVMVGELDWIVGEITEDTGKVDVEALMSDVLPTVEIINYYEKEGPDILGREKRKTPFYLRQTESYVEYDPLGVVLVISPWNYPLQLSMIPTISALMAGNTVILKPSEVTPLTGKLSEEIMKRAGLPENVFQVVQGGGEVGSQLIDAGPDKVFFTGSVETGKKIARQASDQLIPVELELGGKDPMIVFDDADLDRAVEGALYGAFSNAGQICVSVERCYVQSGIYEEFVESVTSRTMELTVGTGRDADIGPIISPHQLEVIEEQVTDAVDKGARLLTEMKRNGNFFYPQVLVDVDHSMKVMTEETFGPLLPIKRFDSESEAIELANDSRYGLNSSVWSSDVRRAERAVRKLDVGNSFINDVVKNSGNPYLPFGGAKQSGIGAYHGPEGLKAFSRRKSVMVSRGRGKEPNWFPYTGGLYDVLKRLIRTLFGEPGPMEKVKNYVSLFRELG